MCTKASINIRFTGYVTAFSEFNDIRQVGRTAFKELLGVSFPIRVYLKTVRLDIKIRYPVVYCATVMESAVLVKVSKSAPYTSSGSITNEHGLSINCHNVK